MDTEKNQTSNKTYEKEDTVNFRPIFFAFLVFSSLFSIFIANTGNLLWAPLPMLEQTVICPTIDIMVNSTSMDSYSCPDRQFYIANLVANLTIWYLVLQQFTLEVKTIEI